MDRYLIGSLDPDSNVRQESYKVLQTAQKIPGFATSLIELSNTQDLNLKLLSLIMLKNTISKYWAHKNKFSDEDKNHTKAFLLNNLEGTEKMSEMAIESIRLINKYDYIDTWSTLERYLHQIQFNSKTYFKLLYIVLKTQLSKGSIRAKNTVKSLHEALYKTLYGHWSDCYATMNKFNILLDKIMTKFISSNGTSKDVEAIISRTENYIITPAYELNSKVILKCLLGLILKSQALLQDFIPKLIQIYLTIIRLLKPSSIIAKDILDYVFLGFKEILKKFPESKGLIENQAGDLMNKTLCTELDERWQLWNQGNFENFLESTDETDEDSTRKFQEVLLGAFPSLFSSIRSLMSTNIDFLKVHTISNLFSILPKFPSACYDTDFKSIITWLSSFNTTGIEKLVLLRDTLILIRKWANVIKDIEYAYNLLLIIKNSTNDQIILYESCLTLKQLMYLNLSSGILYRAVEDFSLTAFSLINEMVTPQCIWHLVTLVSNLIEFSSNTEVFLNVLAEIGLKKLVVESNPMVMISVGDMLGRLVVKYPGNETINQATASHISQRLSNEDKQAVTLWLEFLVNFKGEQWAIDSLLPNLKSIKPKQLEMKIKILEEYLLIYHETRSQDKILEFTNKFCSEACELTGSAEYDYISLELVFCITRLSSFDKTQVFEEAIKYLNLDPVDIYNSLCIQYSLLIIASVLIISPQLSLKLDFNVWVPKLNTLVSHNHLILIHKAITSIAPYINSTIHPDHQGVLSNYLEKYSNSSFIQENKQQKSYLGTVSVSERFINYLFI